MSTMEDLGRQLRCPSGTEAKQVAEQMFASNKNMILNTLHTLNIRQGQRILELGIGNGRHIPYLLAQTHGLSYTGLDISDAMLAEAAQQAENLQLIKVSGRGDIPLEDGGYQRFFTVNTLYFWVDIHLQLREIYRVMAGGGFIAIAYIEKTFGEHLPFTRSGFQFRETGEVEQTLKESGFVHIHTHAFTETVISKTGTPVERPYFISTAKK